MGFMGVSFGVSVSGDNNKQLQQLCPTKTRCNYLRLLRNEDLGFQINQVTQMSLNTSGKCRNSRKGGRRLLWWTSVMSSSPAETIQTTIFSINPFKKYPCIHWRDYPFPSAYSWLLYCKLIDHIFTGLFLDLYSVPLMNVSVFMSIQSCFNYSSFEI